MKANKNYFYKRFSLPICMSKKLTCEIFTTEKKEIYTNLTSANQRQMKTLEGPPADALRLLAAGG